MSRVGDFIIGCMEEAHVPIGMEDAATEAYFAVDADGLPFEAYREAVVSAMRQAVERAEKPEPTNVRFGLPMVAAR